MSADALFCSLTSIRIADLIRSAQQAVCYAGPGIQSDVAQAMVETASRLGPEMMTVCLDFDERVMRMGYGEIGAVNLVTRSCVAEPCPPRTAPQNPAQQLEGPGEPEAMTALGIDTVRRVETLSLQEFAALASAC